MDVRKTVVYFGIAALLCASGAGGRRTCVIVNEREACVDRAAHPHRPLLVFLHGYGSSGHDDQLMLAALAKSHDISYAAPDALPNESGNREWNDADIAFVSALIRSLVLATNADAMRVYLVGNSEALSKTRVAATLVVYLASGAADALSGRNLDVSDDVAQMVTRAAEIEEHDLYVLRQRE